ncbi:hypothetical protein FTV88_1854 [Heliorestis convoluta]|uniref:Uncharacterized protein n=1 Tax=Heliorestis convoluta TaxID=356322 RepID=A0A5Q2N3S0_9FIRM|nr:hypothetical protein FTV88_1854 [Heliorestis convoluta]
MHIDTDEANAAAIKNGELVTLLLPKEAAKATTPYALV